MKPIDIHGKKYYPVAERVKEFYKQHTTGRIETEIINITDDSVLVRAQVFTTNNKDEFRLPVLRSTGHAYEEKSWGKINVRSMVENCETSAVGRALAFLNIGISDDIASAEEMQNVEDAPPASYVQTSMIESLLDRASIPDKHRKDIEAELPHFTLSRAGECIKYLKENQVEKSLNEQFDDKLKSIKE